MNLRLLRDLDVQLFMKIFLVNYPLYNSPRDTNRERWPIDILCGFVNKVMETFSS